jgi:hypothetical protein
MNKKRLLEAKESKLKMPEENSMQHHARAKREAKANGGIKKVNRTKNGVQIDYKNGTGYWLGN